MAITKWTAWWGAGSGKSNATFTGKAAKQAYALGKSADGVAQARWRAPRYYSAPSLGTDAQGKPCRRRLGTVNLMEIRYYQKHVGLLIPLLPFSRLVREVAEEVSQEGFWFQSIDIKALQESSEAYLISLLEDSQLCTFYEKCMTLIPKDMQLARRLRRDVVTDDAVESFTQVMAQRRIQVEREARQREKEIKRLREEREARLEEARKGRAELLRKIQEQAKKMNGATSETEVGKPTNSTGAEDRPTSTLE